MSLFAPLLPSEIEAIERAKVARKKPHLALVGSPPRPDRAPIDLDMFAWRSVEELWERGR